MKSGVLFLILFVFSFSFVSATCINYFDEGNDADTFGYVDVNGVLYEDTCSSNTQLK